MPIAVLYPRFDHSAIEERYASWQTQMLLRRGKDVSRIIFYEVDEPAKDVAGDVEESHVLVVTDPLLLPSSGLAVRLREALASGAAAAVPMTNTAAHPKQVRAPVVPYLTLR